MNQELNADDRADIIAGLVERIANLNQVIVQRQADVDADPLAIEEFTFRRKKYILELNRPLQM